MGAQDPVRLKRFMERYKYFEDPTGEQPITYNWMHNALRFLQLMCLLVSFTHAGENTPPYYYGTHYSSAMIVASFLIRMEPFTQHFLKLQVGLFEYLSLVPFHVITYLISQI